MSFSEFLDAYPPGHIKGYPFYASPRWSTDVSVVKGGSERANQNWEAPLHKFTAPKAIRNWADFEAVQDMWWVTNGPFRSWPFRSPMDCSTAGMEALNTPRDPTATDCLIATTDGVTRFFQLRRGYTYGGDTYYRDLNLPVVASVLLALDGIDPSTAPGGPFTWTITREGGLIEFASAPPAGRELTGGALFDVLSRFESDDAFDGIAETFRAGGFADLTFIEQRAC
jgi:uncharacterized protein (TIGR02217 family)